MNELVSLIKEIEEQEMIIMLCECAKVLCIGLGMFFALTGLFKRQHNRDDSNSFALGIVVFMVGIMLWTALIPEMEKGLYNNYTEIVDNYDYACYYNGEEVNPHNIDMSKYEITFDKTNNAIQLTDRRPIYYGYMIR